MGRPYENELAFLDATYAAALAADIGDISSCLSECQSMQLAAVGSGGSYTAAHFSAYLHENMLGVLSRSLTPLDAVSSLRRGTDILVMLITAGGSNPDILGAFKRLAEMEPSKLVVLCGRKGSPLAKRAAAFAYVNFFESEVPSGKDGFLATNSLLWFAVIISRVYLKLARLRHELPRTLSELLHHGTTRADFIKALSNKCANLWARNILVVLHGPETSSAAIDLESKFTEAALGVIQPADFRSFAHGRHHWLAKHGNDTAILALTTEMDGEIAGRTLKMLPKNVPTALISIPRSGIEAALAAIITGYFIAGFCGRARNIDPGRPGVPSFGRKIYHLRAFTSRPIHRNGANVTSVAAIERKAGVPFGLLQQAGEFDKWLDAYREFVRRIQSAQFSAIVLDYDGTLCDTRDRKRGLNAEVASELTRIAKHGLTIAVVTGRGKSVREDLHREIPKEVWNRFVIGYYNGSDTGALSDKTKPATQGCHEGLEKVARHVKESGIIDGSCVCDSRPLQITYSSTGSALPSRLWEILQHAVAATESKATVVRSGHSIDVLAEGVSKRSILKGFAGDEGNVLCIGDRGRWPGNDFVLLMQPHSLSSHEVSGDPCTCWNLAPPGVRGVAATLYYLRSLHRTKKINRMALSLSKSGRGGG